MKNLYNQNFAGFKAKFVWNTPKIETGELQKSFEAMKESVKDTTNKSLDYLIENNKDFNIALTETREKLNERREKMLNGEEVDVGVEKVTEKMVSDYLVKTVNYSDVDKLESKLGLNMSASQSAHANNIDADDDLDLDEFAESQKFLTDYKNLQVVMDELSKSLPLQDEPESAKLAIALSSMKSEIEPLITELETGGLSESEKISKRTQIENILTSKLENSDVDMGDMLENFAGLARAAKIPKADIDDVLDDFVEMSKPGADYDVGDAEPGSMEYLMIENKELTSFFAEYYPPRDFEKDLEKYSTSTFENLDGTTFQGSVITEKNFKTELPNFFWYMNLDGSSISEQLKLYKVDESFERLRKAMILDENRSVQSPSLVDSAKMMFNDAVSAFTSNAPSYFRHFKFGEKDFNNADNIEDLFKNKLSGVLGGNKVSLAGVKNLTRKLTVKDDPESMAALIETIPEFYYGGDVAKKYKKAIKEGQTRQDFKSWLKSNDLRTGEPRVSKMENIMNLFKRLGRFFLRMKVFFHLASNEEKDELKEIDDRRENGEHDEELDTALKNKKTVEKANTNKDKWHTEKSGDAKQAANYQSFIDFHTKNKDILAGISPIDMSQYENHPQQAHYLPDEFGEITPDEFAGSLDSKGWDTTKTREILKWARDPKTPHDQVSKESWKKIRDHQDNLEIREVNGKPALKFIQKSVYKMQSSRFMTEWNDSEIDKLLKPNKRIEHFEKLKKDGVLDEDVAESTFFTDHLEQLFVDPKSENVEFRPFFAGLFGDSIGKFRTEPISAENLKVIFANEKKLNNGFDTVIDPDGNFLNREDNDYYRVNEDGEFQEVADGKIVGTNDVEAEPDKTGWFVDGQVKYFEVSLDGEGFGDSNFTSIAALIEKLKQ